MNYNTQYTTIYSIHFLYVMRFSFMISLSVVILETLILFSQVAAQQEENQQKSIHNYNEFETITERYNKQDLLQKEGNGLSMDTIVTQTFFLNQEKFVPFTGLITTENSHRPYSLKTNFSIYNNPYLGISISFPQTWHVKEQYNPIIEIVAPAENNFDKFGESVRIYFMPPGIGYFYPPADTQLSTIDSKVKENIENLPEGKILSKNLTTFKDMQAYKIIYTFTDDTFKKPILTKTMALYFIYNNIFYLFESTSELKNYEKVFPLFQKMLDSFEINPIVFDTNKENISIDKNDLSSLYTNTTWKINIPYPKNWIIDKSIDDNGNEDCIYDVISFIPESFSKKDTTDKEGVYLRVNTDAFFVLDLFEIPFNVKNFSKYIEEQYNPAMIPIFWPIKIELNKTMAGQPAFQLFYYKDGGKYKVMETGIIIDKIAYQMIYSAEPKNFDKYLPYVNEMINSMTIESFFKKDISISHDTAKITPVLHKKDHAIITEFCLHLLSGTR